MNRANSKLLVSTFANVNDLRPKDCDVSVILEIIRGKQGKLKERVERIRNTIESELTQHGDYKRAKTAIAKLKNALPAVTWSARLKTRDKNVPLEEKIVAATGCLCGDMDGLHGDLPNVRAKISASPYLMVLFESPSRDGLKPVFHVPADASLHLGSYLAVQQHIADLCGEEIARKLDEKSKDITRLCFLSYDPDLYFNPKAIEIKPLPVPEKPERQPAANTDLSERGRIAVEIVGPITWESETRGYATCPGKHLHHTADGDRDCRIDLDGAPTIYCFHNSCAGIIAGTNHELRSRIGIDETEFVAAEAVETREELNPNNTSVATSKIILEQLPGEGVTDLSFTSLDDRRFPASLGTDAYHGLAGEIVQRILPETEADPAGLLFTFLTGFGNMVNRAVYMIADGAYHYLNLFVVTVGRTAISRKGTAWAQVKRVLALIDKDWTSMNIEGGLSSGEGVVHRIRDQISEEKPVKKKGRYTGDYQTVTVDPGIDDKRLFALETEFCSPLKVMSREGNNLSPVLRAGWDGNDLGTLTKNSRERATNPHLSLVGHITREELRRNLNETEMANGFGNRILWVAVKRSQVLPRGGTLPIIVDLQERLQEASLFAQTCGELVRDEEAEELWAQIYPDLSEGRPGLLGAIIARAAPQVLRLSGLYAVLDCSSAIQKAHLKAALACWRYAEASARWIFETGTGNKFADRILIALIAAGAKGLTRSEISCDLFGRNVTKFTLDEALRLLHHLELAKRLMENGGKGRPTEKWFFRSSDELNEFRRIKSQ